MITLDKNDYLLFDGDCGICTSSAEICRGIDSCGQFDVLPYQTIPENELSKFGLDYRRCSGQLQLITSRGKVYSGVFAVNYFFFQYLPWSILVVVIYAIPVFLLVEFVGYRLVARNRQRISKWLGLKACLVKQE